MKLLAIILFTVFTIMFIGCSDNTPVEPIQPTTIEKTAPPIQALDVYLFTDNKDYYMVVVNNYLYYPIQITEEQFNYMASEMNIRVHH